MQKRTFLVLFLAGLLALSPALAQHIRPDQLRKHVRVLAADSLLGRGTGTSAEKMAASYIISHFKSGKITPWKERYDQPFPFKRGAHGTGAEGVGRNVVAYINNRAPETIVIGAHYDHLGLGHDGNSLDANAQDKIHNGADDNASGVAGVLELARYFRMNGTVKKYNLLFVLFSGEELGLYGSKYFVENLPPDLSVNFMINLDMIGRLDVSRGLSVSGTGTAAVWEPALQRMDNLPFAIKTDSSGMGPSDHASFYLKNIPALHFFTGSHSDYHKPSDDWEKLNYEGMAQVLDVIIRLVEDVAQQPRLSFLPTKNRSLGSARAFRVTMGVMPSYTSDVEGLAVDGVTEGKPAQRAGIQAGDVIVQMGDVEVKGVQTYMEALGKFEKGQTIDVRVKRGGDYLMLKVTF